MKRSKIILAVLILSMIALVFSGCGTTPNITQNGSISGRITVPDNFKKSSESWTYPLTDASVDTIDSEGKKHITTTDNDGYYNIFDVAPGYNYIINAEGTKKSNAIILKDVVEEVKAGENYNAGTADAESTSLALALEKVAEKTGTEIKNINIANIYQDNNFNNITLIVTDEINNGNNVMTSSLVSESLEKLNFDTIIEPSPQDKKAGISGYLVSGCENRRIVNGYVFVLNLDGDILDYTTTLDEGAGPDSGFWQFGGLPFGETVTIVGFHPKYKFYMAMGDFDLDVQFKDIGEFETECAIIDTFLSSDGSVPTGIPLGLVSLALTIFQDIATIALNNQAITLTSYLLYEIGYYDEFEIIAGNIYNVSPLPEFYELGKGYSTEVFAQNTGEKETIFRIIPSHEVVDQEKNRSKATSGISFDPEFRFITLKPGQSGSRNFKFTLDTFKSDRIIKFSLKAFPDYASDWELVGEEYKIPVSFNEEDFITLNAWTITGYDPYCIMIFDDEYIPDRSIFVYWSKISNAEGYKVYRSVNGSNSFDLVYSGDGIFHDALNIGAEEIGWFDFNTNPGNSYSYKVSYMKNGQESTPSEITTRSVWLPECSLKSPTDYNPEDPNDQPVIDPNQLLQWNSVNISYYPYQGKIFSGMTEIWVCYYNTPYPVTGQAENLWGESFNNLITSSTRFKPNNADTPLIPGADHIYAWETRAVGYDNAGEVIAMSWSGARHFFYMGPCWDTYNISKGSGTHEFRTTIKPKDCGNKGNFNVWVCIDEIPEIDNLLLDCDEKILTFC